MGGLVKSDSTETYTIGTHVTVVVRVRPLNFKELDKRDVRNCLHVGKNVVSVDRHSEFIFDHVIKSNEDNVYLYEQIGEPLLDHALEGYNVCMFAYGQTGSGKTHSIMGREGDPGLMYQFVSSLFDRVGLMTKQESTRVKVECSYYEIYNEKIHDLLGNDCRTALRVREHPENGPYIVDLSTIECSSYQDAVYWINIAQKRRLNACTAMNQNSSRSHTIFTLVITQDKNIDAEFKQSMTSKVNIVDLAGSERSHLVNGVRLRETVGINRSLLTLGKVITQLAEYSFIKGSCSSFIPYRESALTWLLKESLGGNSKTTMIATVSPASIHQDETLTTLRYAATARRVVNIVKINEDPKIRRIRELEHEVEVLKQRIAIMENSAQVRGRSSSACRPSLPVPPPSPLNDNRRSNCQQLQASPTEPKTVYDWRQSPALPQTTPLDHRRRSNIANRSPIRVYKTADIIEMIKDMFRDILDENSPPDDSPPKDSPPKDSPPKDSPPKDSAPKDSAPKASPPKVTPPKVTPAKATPAKATPAKTTPAKAPQQNRKK